MEQPVKTSGFIKIIILIVIVLVLLGYFGFDVKNILKSPVVIDNLNFVWDIVIDLWHKYLEAPVQFIWEKIVIELLWNNLTAILEKAKESGVMNPK
ncbi:MAG: hypothetical protein AAB511_00590 [Patescibacteria group bacterium]|mgnify:CR=1 FL=1